MSTNVSPASPLGVRSVVLYTEDLQHFHRGVGDMDERTSGGRDRLLTPGEVAALFRVDPKTVTRWAAAGRIGSIRTPGGHRRFRESEVRALLSGETPTIPQQAPPVDRLPAGT